MPFTLLTLNISYNNITDNGMVNIYRCLKHNSTLRKLDLSFNRYRAKTVMNIAKALQENSRAFKHSISTITASLPDCG